MNSDSNELTEHQQKVQLKNISELLSYAHAMEVEACERYTELADLMEAHNNKQVTKLFRTMASHEKQHGEEIRQWADKNNLPILPNAHYQWTSPEGPETCDPADLHYLMTPNQALTLALHNEQRARKFFSEIVKYTSDEQVREFAGHLAQEEMQHVVWMQQWLSKFPKTQEGWDDDDDPPVLQD